MEIIKFLVYLLFGDNGLSIFSSLFGPETKASSTQSDEEPDPETDRLFEEIFKQKNSPKFIGEGYALQPISQIADKEIIYGLTRYFGKS